MRRAITRDSDGYIDSYDGHPVWRLSALKAAKGPRAPLYVINLKGCNGSGKSTVPIRMIKGDEQTVLITMSVDDKKPVATFCPQFQVVILGTYLTACGGCDSLGNTQVVKELLKKLWKKDVHILYEGVIVGDIKSTFYEVMIGFRNVHPRDVHFCFMGTKLEECLRRIQKRNGGKDINTDLVQQKYKNSVGHLKYYVAQGDVGVEVLKTHGTMQDVFKRFCAMFPRLGPAF
jgi:predicted ABC-type ATPase